MSFYLFFNLVVIAFPLIFSFERRRIRFYSKIKPLLIALLLVGIFFVGWDIFATTRGHWSFNPAYVYRLEVFGLPMEELFFFITVPYSCLFIYEAILYFFGDSRLISPRKWIVLAAAVLVISGSLQYLGNEYTFLAILSIGLTFLFVTRINFELFCSKAYWLYILLTLFLFLIFNYFLTSLPVVQYSTDAIIGFRVLTIPIEDFMFNFSMLTNYLAVYNWALTHRKIK